MRPHEWRAVPMQEALEKNMHYASYPYAWECRICSYVVLTNSEEEPDLNKVDSFRGFGRYVGTIFFADCDFHIVVDVLDA